MFVASSKFARASDDAKKALLATLLRRSYGNNEVIYLQDDGADHLYFVISGHVRLSYIMEDGSAILYAILPAGDSFGELGIFDGGTHCDMAMAIGETLVGCISITNFRALAARFPDLHDALTRLVARRYRSYIDLTRVMSLKTLPARVAQVLLRLTDGLGTRIQHHGYERPCVGPVVTQADLGLMARGARGNVNRALKTWERAGWIALKDRSILVINRAQLENLAIKEDF
jgi:CRP/FNR family cyclic AMP-dependent transcriptional regulator